MNVGKSPGIDPGLGMSFDLGGRHVEGPENVVLADFTSLQVNGSFPFVVERSAFMDGEVGNLIPSGLAVSRHVVLPGGRNVVLAGDGECSLMIQLGGSFKSKVAVAASSLKRAQDVLDSALAGVPEPRADDRTKFQMWHMDGTHAVSRTVRIDAPPWTSISRNYPPSVRDALTRLVELDGPNAGGRLILWHGAPGTGKTTAIQSLARQWSSWCRAVYIADPERLFADTSYLTEVITKEPQSAGAGTRWQLVIAEDTDEYLRSSARRVAGAALGRLLNVTDGILGHGSKTLLLLTTNERIDRLHPALTRPGRCMANVEFTPFAAADAARWLPAGMAVPTESRTLAELYELSGGAATISTQATAPETSGAYL